MSYYPEFAERLDQYLAAQARSGAWLAQRLGVNPATVTRWRNGDARPSKPEVVMQVADLLGIYGEERGQLLQAVGYAFLEAQPISAPTAVQTAGLPPPQREAYAIRTAPRLSYPPTYRQGEMAILQRWLEIGASGLVLGLAGSGVSTLLRYLAQRPLMLQRQAAHAKMIVPVWSELQPATEATAAVIYHTLLHGILESAALAPEHFSPTLLQTSQRRLQTVDPFSLQTALFELVAHCQAANVGLLFVVDRIDQLSATSQRNVSNTLCALRNRFRETIMLFMGMRITPDYQEQIYALGELGRLLSTQTCIVGTLTAQDSRFMIDQWTKLAGMQPDATDIEQFLWLSGGFPTLLKAVVHWWLLQTPRLPRAEWHHALSQELSIGLRLREIWECLAGQEQLALQTMISNPATTAVPPVVGAQLARLGLCRQGPQGWQVAGALLTGLANVQQRK